MPAAANSVFDIAFWFSDRALNNSEYLQPLKLQYLLYLSQSYFAAAHNGRKLVPAIFVAEELGPIEPSVHRAWTQGRPNFGESELLNRDVKVFVDSIWRRFGHHSAEYLSKICRRTAAYQVAYKNGVRAEIILREMIDGIKLEPALPDVEQLVKPKLVRSSHTGRAVEVTAWAPPVLDRKK
jgi:uncharacterized phage-associated protein